MGVAVRRLSARVAVGGWVTLAVLTQAATANLSAQVLCSAPHSSPTLAAGGSLGTLAPGSGWAQVSVFRQKSSGFFGPDALRRPFPAEGAVRITSVYLTAAAGIFPGLDVWVQTPLHHARYEDVVVTRSRLGVGDARIALRLSPTLLGAQRIPIALRAGVKVPGSSFPVDATIIPLTEGQRDWEASLETGHAFAGLPLYVLGWLGYRWREENDAVRRDPGNELYVHAAVGGSAASVRWELATELLLGEAPRLVGVTLPTGRRRLVQLTPSLGRRVGLGDLELGGVIPLAGRNLPTGPAVSAGYRIWLGT